MNAFFEHFRFSQPWWLFLLIPVAFLPILRRGRGAEAVVTFPNLGVLVSLGRRVRQSAWSYGFPLAILALTAAVLSMARPVWRNVYESRMASGIDIMIAFDVSLSMDIDDFRQNGMPLKRIDAAKEVVDDFINRRTDDRLGLVAFAGRPVSVSPITLDHDWVRAGLKNLKLNDDRETGSVQEQGTAIGSAIAASATRLDERESASKVIVLITDGASNSGKISPLEAAEHAKTLGIKIYTVAIGTKDGRVSRGIQRFPRQEFDLPTLKEIARKTGGEDYWAQDLTALQDTFKSIDKLEKTETKSFTTIDDIELCSWFTGAAVLLALLAAMLITLNPPPSA
ncbi:VWA domain-containing protein [Luteolibacter pohnpeiensis]|uniref:VWA domain-containing protein n=1 Tax=Luteolibacter pohnpeiensis TaxID=454153 RepID=A0A934S9A5_9BACT|nr:VWA domain-containing protein [Luteolibacter pohnpeiensis]MBK1883231.1 VWA domain-containing protein [Luteolibacter pohnpeiensis]